MNKRAQELGISRDDLDRKVDDWHGPEAAAQHLSSGPPEDEPVGTFACPYCGLDTPHYHSPEDVEALRALKLERVRFETAISTWLNRQDVLQAFRIYHTSLPFLLLELSASPTETYANAIVELLWQLWQNASRPAASPSSLGSPQPHVHECVNPTSACQARGYCECECGARRSDRIGGWYHLPPDFETWAHIVKHGTVPGSPPELKELLDELGAAIKIRTITGFAFRAWRNRVESFVASRERELATIRASALTVDERDICDLCGETWKSDGCCYWSANFEKVPPRTNEELLAVAQQTRRGLSDAEPETLIDRVVETTRIAEQCVCESMPCEHAGDYRTARLSLEEYVRRLEEALVMFREEQARDKETIAALRRGEDVNT